MDSGLWKHCPFWNRLTILVVFIGSFVASFLSVATAADVAFRDIRGDVDLKPGAKLSLDLPGAKRGGSVRISNLSVGKVSAYLNLSSCLVADGSDLFINGVRLSGGSGLFGGARKVERCLKLSVPEDDVLEIARIDSGGARIFFPSLKTTLCFAVVNKDGSVVYLLNCDSDGEYVKFARNVAPKDYAGSLGSFSLDLLSALVLNPGMERREVRRESAFGFASMLNAFKWKKDLSLPPLFACEVVGTSLEKLGKAERKLKRKFTLVVTDVSVLDFLGAVSRSVRGSFETTFWGAVVFPDYRGDNSVIKRGRLGRVLGNKHGRLLVQMVDDPGRIVVVPVNSCVKVEVETE